MPTRNIKLGINTGFALNRFTTPEQWVPLVADTLGLKIVQLTADLINPSLGPEITSDLVSRLQKLCQHHGVQIRHVFTGAFTRVNHMAHPDPQIRKFWIHWFSQFASIARDLGAESMGSHFGILTTPDNNDPVRRKERFLQLIDGWKTVAEDAKSKGFKFLTWEPMSISREFGETIIETKRIQKIVNDGIAIPMKLCLDVDHGDVTSPNPDDTDPYAWIHAFAKETPLIHLKQTLMDKGGHWPFTPEHNARGKITPERLLTALDKAGYQDVTLLLELSFREREPADSRVIQDTFASVNYWRPHLTTS